MSKFIKISEWLAGIDSHSIYNSAKLKDDFAAKTGHQPDWPESSVKVTRELINNDPRGGYVDGDDSEKVAYGYVIAQHFAGELANFKSQKFGRGSSFWDNIEAIKNAGF